jgi:hypothetical protein
MSYEPIPCKDCICFALCNSKVKQLNGVYKTHFIMRQLIDCSLFNDWYIHRTPFFIKKAIFNPDTNYYEKTFSNFYNIKYDVNPDIHLLRHLKDSNRGL